jgi:hypothetical protein
MNTHHIKILPEHYHNVKIGTKTFEIRNNDRAYQKFDVVVLHYYSRSSIDAKHDINYWDRDYEPLLFKVGDVYPIDADRVVFSLLKLE